MAKIRINGDTSGYIEISAPAVAGSTSITLPATTGGSLLATDASGNLNVDSGTFYVDGTNNRVGIGTSSPTVPLEISATGAGIKNIINIKPGISTTGEGGAITFSNLDPGSNQLAKIASVFEGGTFSASLRFYTNTDTEGASPSEKMRITPTGRVGIGTSTFSDARQSLIVAPASGQSSTFLTVKGSSSSANTWLFFGDSDSDSTGGILYEHSTDAMGFRTSAGERARIDSSGRLLVGMSSSSADATLVLMKHSGDANGPGILHLSNPNSAPGSGAGLGLIRFSNSTQNTFASIEAYADAASGSNDYPGRLVFSTTADGASSPTERMRIRQNGNIGIGVTGYDVVRLAVNGQSTTSSDYALAVYNSSSADLFNVRNDGVFATGTQAGSPYNNTTAVAANMHVNSGGNLYRSTSSARFKTDIETLQDQYADAILNVRPVWYRSLCASDNQEWGYWGFIAEEVAEVDPRLVFWKTHETVRDENGKQTSIELEEPLAESVQYDRFVPHLLNLIKRQGEAIAELQDEVTALKAR